MVTFCWMLQCISPYLTIDQNAFQASMDQYQRWLDEVRYNCTYYHTGWTDWVKSKVPTIPVINPPKDPLTPPKRSHSHPHPDFDYGYGTGPIVDSYTTMYKLAGSVPRVPGRCDIEVYDKESQEYKLSPVNGYGQTNEYIHPVCYYRDLIRGPEPNSALREFTRTFEPTEGVRGKGRFWWQKKGDPQKIPEWMILEHKAGQINFERICYSKSEKTPEKKAILEKKGIKNDWMDTLDEQNDFSIWKRPEFVYP